MLTQTHLLLLLLKDIGASSRTDAILIPHSPGNLASLTEQMRHVTEAHRG